MRKSTTYLYSGIIEILIVGACAVIFFLAPIMYKDAEYVLWLRACLLFLGTTGLGFSFHCFCLSAVYRAKEEA